MENKELETWLKETKAKNLSLHQLAKHISMIDLTSNDIYCHLEGEQSEDKAQILFNQWQKEAEFSPKRGDRVLVWNDDDYLKGYERIFLAEIKGDKQPIIAVMLGHEELFLSGEKFNSCKYKNMKPLLTEQPTETDFKSKVIELIEGKINATTTALETIISIQKDLLEQVKNIC